MDLKFYWDKLGYKRDASESVFFSRQLEHLRAKAFDVEYPTLKALGFMSVDYSVDPGAETFTYEVFNKTGTVKVAGGYSTASPRADVFGTEASSKIRPLRNSYGLNIQESRAAALANLPLKTKKMMAARWLIAKEHDDILLSGNTTAGLKGLFNQTLADVTEYTIPVGAYGDTEWINAAGTAGKTAKEIHADMSKAVHLVVTDSNEVEQPNTLILPLSRYNLINELTIGVDNTTTVLQHFLNNNKYIKRVESSIKLETAGAGSSKRFVAYNDSADKLEGVIPVEFEQFAPEARGLEFVTECHGRSGGCVIYYPKSVCYADAI